MLTVDKFNKYPGQQFPTCIPADHFEGVVGQIDALDTKIEFFKGVNTGCSKRNVLKIF